MSAEVVARARFVRSRRARGLVALFAALFSGPLRTSRVRAETTTFGRILDGDLPAAIVYEDDVALAFDDIHPQAPVHVVVIPKRRDILRISELPPVSVVTTGDQAPDSTPDTKGQNDTTAAINPHAGELEVDVVLGHLLRVAGRIGRQKCGAAGFRLVINDGPAGGQSVYHLHVHVLGGRPLAWPPG